MPKPSLVRSKSPWIGPTRVSWANVVPTSGVSVPSAPGYIGSFQLGCVAALQIFGVQKDAALAFSLIIHLTQFIGVIAAGLYSLWTENMTFSQMEAVGESDVSTA